MKNCSKKNKETRRRGPKPRKVRATGARHPESCGQGRGAKFRVLIVLLPPGISLCSLGVFSCNFGCVFEAFFGHQHFLWQMVIDFVRSQKSSKSKIVLDIFLRQKRQGWGVRRLGPQSSSKKQQRTTAAKATQTQKNNTKKQKQTTEKKPTEAAEAAQTTASSTNNTTNKGTNGTKSNSKIQQKQQH